MVRKERLELSQVTPLEPKSSASTNFATFAQLKPLPLKTLTLKPMYSLRSAASARKKALIMTLRPTLQQMKSRIFLSTTPLLLLSPAFTHMWQHTAFDLPEQLRHNAARHPKMAH